jgi:hypothetical protein
MNMEEKEPIKILRKIIKASKKPVTLDELKSAMAIVASVFTGKVAPIQKPSRYGAEFCDGKGRVTEKVSFTDVPFNRAMFAVCDQFPPDKAAGLWMRCWAIGDVLKSPKVQRWVEIGEEETAISDDLLYAIAVCPFSKRLRLRSPDIVCLAKQHAMKPKKGQ